MAVKLDPSVPWCWWCHTPARLLPGESDLPRCDRCLERTPRRPSEVIEIAAVGRLLPKDEATLLELVEVYGAERIRLAARRLDS